MPQPTDPKTTESATVTDFNTMVLNMEVHAYVKYKSMIELQNK